MRFAVFIVRFLAYAIVLGVAYAVAQGEWVREGLDLVDDLAGYHAVATTVLAVAPFALALLAMVARRVSIFLLFYLAAAAVTAPFALARLAG